MFWQYIRLFDNTFGVLTIHLAFGQHIWRFDNTFLPFWQYIWRFDNTFGVFPPPNLAFRPTQLGVILSTFFSSIVSTLFQIDAILTLILNSDIPKSSQDDLLRAERRAGQLKNVAGDGGDGHDGENLPVANLQIRVRELTTWFTVIWKLF